MCDFDLSSLTNEELDERLYQELLYFEEDIYQLSRIIRKQLPRKFIYRIISKLYRLRNQ